MNQKSDFSNRDLLEFALGECTEDRKKAISEALDNSSDLRDQLERLQSVVKITQEKLAIDKSFVLSKEQKRQILSRLSARTTSRKPHPAKWWQGWSGWKTPALVACATGLAIAALFAVKKDPLVVLNPSATKAVDVAAVTSPTKLPMPIKTPGARPTAVRTPVIASLGGGRTWETGGIQGAKAEYKAKRMEKDIRSGINFDALGKGMGKTMDIDGIGKVATGLKSSSGGAGAGGLGGTGAHGFGGLGSGASLGTGGPAGALAGLGGASKRESTGRFAPASSERIRQAPPAQDNLLTAGSFDDALSLDLFGQYWAKSPLGRSHQLRPFGSQPNWKDYVVDLTSRRFDKVQLAFVFDTTGSMDDELDFVKSEFQGITEAIRKRFPQVDQEYAMIAYRDNGDEYVTRGEHFTAKIEDFMEFLNEQSASGGGDKPEAVHRAFDDAVNRLEWKSDSDVARLVFWVADASPHQEYVQETIDHSLALKKKGVRVFSVAASGTDDVAEAVFRTVSLITGGQYVFLTDDSGVGLSHQPPKFPCYHVEKLKGLVIRLVSDVLEGRHTDPDSQELIRTVGEPREGRCLNTSAYLKEVRRWEERTPESYRPFRSGPKVNFELTTTGPIARDVASAVVRANLAQIKACYERHLLGRVDSPSSESLETLMVINDSGRVTVSEVLQTEIKHAATELCMQDAQRRWKFPMSRGGNKTQIHIKYEFSDR